MNPNPLLKFRYLGSFPSDYVPTLDNDTFAIINTQPINMQGEHWIMIANFRHKLYFADSLGCKRYGFLNYQHYKQLMPAPLQSHPSVCGFYTIYAAFHLFKFRQEEITGGHDVNVISFISNSMLSLYVNLHIISAFISCFCAFLYILITFFKLSHNLFTKHQIKTVSACVIKYPQTYKLSAGVIIIRAGGAAKIF